MHDPFVEGTLRDNRYKEWMRKSQIEILEKLTRESATYLADNYPVPLHPVVKKTNEELIQEILDII